MKPFWNLLRAALLLAGLTRGVAAAETPTVDAILDRHLQASGGRAAHERITSVAEVGDLEVLGVAGNANWRMQAKAPNRQVMEVELPVLGKVTEGFDGTNGWGRSALAGLRIKEGDELARTRREATFHRNLRFKSLFPGLAFAGTGTMDGRELRILESKPTKTSRERFLFAADSGLLVQQESEFEGPEGPVRVLVRFGDYRVVEGVKYPFSQRIRLTAGGKDFDAELKLRQVKVNVPVTDAVFAKPGA